jgi:hypothetical protein
MPGATEQLTHRALPRNLWRLFALLAAWLGLPRSQSADLFRDAWGYGAVDASSGTAALMEIVRTFGSLVRAGWRPRRTIGTTWIKK